MDKKSFMIREEDIDIEALRSADDEAYKLLVNRYERPLQSMVAKLVFDSEDAKEIVQDVFLAFFKNIDSFEGRSKVYTWLYKTASNKAIDLIRKRERHKKYRASIAVSSEVSDDFAHRRLDTIVVSTALSKLEDDFRIPLLLTEYDNLSYQDIAEKLNLPLNTVKTRVFRARKKMLEILEDMGVSL